MVYFIYYFEFKNQYSTFESWSWKMSTSQCKVAKLADAPSCLGGGEFGINVAYGLTTKFSFCSMANRSVGGSNPLLTAIEV
ncbi:MAG: hypothetical protein K0R51_553 [Cytophagaceae bacterium]|nr:hypothetical protein [Cytophagaceae bacterium]